MPVPWKRPETLTDVEVVEKPKDNHPVSPSPTLMRRRHRPTLEEQHAEALRLALEAEESFRQRSAVIRDQVIAELQRHKASLPARLDFLVDARIGEDGDCRLYISQNQWHIQRAIMFATASNARNTALIHDLIADTRDLLRKINERMDDHTT